MVFRRVAYVDLHCGARLLYWPSVPFCAAAPKYVLGCVKRYSANIATANLEKVETASDRGRTEVPRRSPSRSHGVPSEVTGGTY